MAKEKAKPAGAAKAASDEAGADADKAAAKGGGRRKLIVLALPAVVALSGAGLWYGGAVPKLLGMKPATKEAHAAPEQPIYVDLPEMVANLDSDPRRPRYLKLRARVEVRDAADAQAVHAAMPRLQDLFQTYLRDMRPEDLRGSMGTYRLREELIARADVAAAPARVADVLFVEMLVQ